MTTNKYATRIQALLDKAESTNSEEEAQALTAKAAELITKYGIEQAELEAARRRDGKGKGDIIERSIWLSGVYCKTLVMGAYQIALTFDGAIYCLKSDSQLHSDYLRVSDGDSRKGLYLKMYGYESDVSQAEILISSITLQAMGAMSKWWKTQSGWYPSEEGIYLRRSYINGYFSGAAQKIRESRLRTINETSSAGVVALRDRASEVQDWAANNLTAIPSRATNAKTYGSAQNAGFSAGSKADVGNSRFASRAAVG